MTSKIYNFIFTTKLGAYLLATYLLVYFSAVFVVGLDHAWQRDMAQQHIEKLTNLSFEQLGEERTRESI